MEKHKKALKIVGYAMILIAVLNAVVLGIDFFSGKFSEAELSKSIGSQWNSELYIPMLIFTIGVAVIFMLLNIFLGVRGIKQANNKVTKYGHITLATVFFVFDVISCIYEIFALKNNSAYNFAFSQNTVSAILLFLYISSAKALRDN